MSGGKTEVIRKQYMCSYFVEPNLNFVLVFAMHFAAVAFVWSVLITVSVPIHLLFFLRTSFKFPLRWISFMLDYLLIGCLILFYFSQYSIFHIDIVLKQLNFEYDRGIQLVWQYDQNHFESKSYRFVFRKTLYRYRY